MASKMVEYSREARASLLEGVQQLAHVVKVTLGPGGHNVAIERKWGAPLVTRDGHHLGALCVFGREPREFRPDELAGYQRLLEVLEQRAMALELMRASLVSKRPFVRVGSEFADPQLATVSLVGAPYGLQHRNLGTVSLIGPMRMDYVKAIEAVRAAARELSHFVEDLYEN